MGKTKVLTWFGAIATILLVASGAFACTAFLGSFTVSGNKGGSVTVNGLNQIGQFGMNQSVGSTVTKASKTGGGFTISTGTSTNGSKLPDNTYNVLYYNSLPILPGYVGMGSSRQWNQDCMSAPVGTQVGTTTTSGGVITGPTSFSFGNVVPLLTNPPGANESAVCISDDSASYGNQAPITII